MRDYICAKHAGKRPYLVAKIKAEKDFPKLALIISIYVEGPSALDFGK